MALYHPHNGRLSDVPIAKVVHRIAPRVQEPIVYKESDDGGSRTSATFPNHRFIEDPQTSTSTELEMSDKSFAATESTRDVTSKFLTMKNQAKMHVYDRNERPRYTLYTKSESDELRRSLAVVKAAKLEYQRARGRMNQRRYRKNQIHKLAGLNEDIRVLREEIDMFHVRRSNRSRTIVIKPTLWGVVGEYFRLFRCGVNPSLSTMSTTRSRQTLQMQYPVEVAHQFSFLQTVMMPRVICGGQRIGVEAHLKEWKTISRTYPDFNMKLVHLGEGPSGDLVATSKAIFTFTEETLCNAFPHLIDNGNKNPIVAKLLGRRLEVDGVTRFTWDETMGRVTKLSFQVDLISPILQVLGSLDLIAIMFNNAFVTPEGHVVVE